MARFRHQFGFVPAYAAAMPGVCRNDALRTADFNCIFVLRTAFAFAFAVCVCSLRLLLQSARKTDCLSGFRFAEEPRSLRSKSKTKSRLGVLESGGSVHACRP